MYDEAVVRGYSFDRRKIGRVRTRVLIPVTIGQVEHEWHHLLQKLSRRNPKLCEQWHEIGLPECHPVFAVRPGPVESWERV